MTVELPYINGKTIQTTFTDGWGFNINRVCILFTDGTALVLTADQGYIKARLETPTIEPDQPTVTARQVWPGE